MIIILFLISLHFLIWHRYKKINNFLIGITIFSSLFLLLFLMLLTVELKSSGVYNGDYGSDANYYWNAFLNVLNGDSCDGYLAPNYVRFGVVVLRFSPNISILWIKITNILLYTLSLNLMLVLYLRRVKQNIDWSFYFLNFVLSTNGIIVWTVIRNLKETFFIFILTSFIFLMDELKHIKCSKILFYSLIFLINYVYFELLNGIRPLGGIISLLVFLASYFLWQIDYYQCRSLSLKVFLKQNIKKGIGVLLITLGIISYVLSQKFYLLLEFRKLFMEEDLVSFEYSSNFSLFMYPLYIFRFILGPGPFRAIRQLLYGDVFQVSTLIGDILIFLGALVWWLILLFLLCIFIFKINTIKNVLKLFDFIAICMIITLAYSFIAGGTGDTRLRAIVYFFSIPVVNYLLVDKNEKDNCNKIESN